MLPKQLPKIGQFGDCYDPPPVKHVSERVCPVSVILAIVLFTPVRHNGLKHRSQYMVLIILAVITSVHNQSFRALYFYSRFGRVAIVSRRFIVPIATMDWTLTATPT